MNLDKLRDARLEAIKGSEELQTAIDRLRLEVEALQARDKHLATAIASLDMAIGDGPEGFTQVVLPAELTDNRIVLTERSNWEIAKELLEEVNQPMTVPEMTAMLHRRGVRIQGDGLRIAMIRRPDVFGKAGYGQYTLTSWAAQESVSEAEPSLSPEEVFASNSPYVSQFVITDGNHI